MCELNEQTRQTIPEINFLENVIALMCIIIALVTLLEYMRVFFFCRNKIDKDNHVTCKVAILITYDWVYDHRSPPHLVSLFHLIP
jgi:hypothetical protein